MLSDSPTQIAAAGTAPASLRFGWLAGDTLSSVTIGNRSASDNSGLRRRVPSLNLSPPSLSPREGGTRWQRAPYRPAPRECFVPTDRSIGAASLVRQKCRVSLDPRDYRSHGKWRKLIRGRRVAALKAPRFGPHRPPASLTRDPSGAPPRGAAANAVKLVHLKKRTGARPRRGEPPVEP